MPLVCTTPPTGPAVDPEVVKRHLGIEHSEDDETVLELIEAATQLIQDEVAIQLLDSSWSLKLDAFPCGREEIQIERPRVTEIEEVTYVDRSGIERTLDAEDFQFDGDSQPARIVPAAGTCWPRVKCGTINAVEIAFKCGESSIDSVPAAARKLIIALCAYWYENRVIDDLSVRGSSGGLPDSPFFRRQLDHLRWI